MFTGADAYDRFMGRYSVPLSPLLADFAGVCKGGVGKGERVLDVGCGPGALTSELVRRLEPGSVSAIDPSEPFVEAARARHPGVDVRRAAAEQLPFEDGVFDASLAQLVVHFMADPVAGLREMARVTRAGGVIAACVWDFTEGGGPLARFWTAVREFDPDAEDESLRAGARRGHLAELLREVGLDAVEETALTVGVHHARFEDWWSPFTLGVGPAGSYFEGLDAEQRDRLRERCAQDFPASGLTVSARAWAARGRSATPSRG